MGVSESGVIHSSLPGSLQESAIQDLQRLRYAMASLSVPVREGFGVKARRRGPCLPGSACNRLLKIARSSANLRALSHVEVTEMWQLDIRKKLRQKFTMYHQVGFKFVIRMEIEVGLWRLIRFGNRVAAPHLRLCLVLSLLMAI